jgi:hypothetical protein
MPATTGRPPSIAVIAPSTRMAGRTSAATLPRRFAGRAAARAWRMTARRACMAWRMSTRRARAARRMARLRTRTARLIPRPGPRRRPVRPAILIAIPRPAPIIVTPIGTDREGDDRKANRRPVRDHRHIASLVGIAQVLRIDPAPQIGQGDIAPCVTADATHHRDGNTRRQLGHDRVIARGSRAEIDRPARIGLRLLCQRDARQSRQAQKPRTNPSNKLSSHHVSGSSRLPAGAATLLRASCH